MRARPQPAIEQFKKALELFPDHARSLVGLGAALPAAGDAAGAQTPRLRPRDGGD